MHNFKAMYEQLFTFIFTKINEILDIKNTIKSNEITSKNSTVIGVLDIYGFEIFESNG
jgi:myosin-1